MSLSPREQEVLALLREDPGLDTAGLAVRLGTTKGAVAVTLSSLTRKGEIIGRSYQLRHEPTAVVVGGAAWDVKARSNESVILHTSNPGLVTRTPGGVGRNISEAIARLGNRVQLVAAVGNDSEGRDLLTLTAKAGVSLDQIITSSQSTASYLAALDDNGELVIGLSDFSATDSLNVNDVVGSKDVIARADVVVVDANIPATVVQWVLSVTSANNVATVIEPVSVTKAARIAHLINNNHPVFVVTPNVDELAALVGHTVANNKKEIAAAAHELHERGVKHVWVSMGSTGSLLISAGSKPVSIPARSVEVVDVTGAGDALTAGFVHGILAGHSPQIAARFGHLAAALTVTSPQTSRPDLGEAFAQAVHEIIEKPRKGIKK